MCDNHITVDWGCWRYIEIRLCKTEKMIVTEPFELEARLEVFDIVSRMQYVAMPQDTRGRYWRRNKFGF